MSLQSLSLDAVIVDLDGTMVDTLGDFEVALNRTMADLGLPPVDRAFIAHSVGKGTEHLVRTVLSQQLRGHSGSEVEALLPLALAQYQAHYLAINGQYSDLYPGVLEGLQALGRLGLRLACLTNKPLAFARPLLEIKSLAPHFRHVFGGDSFERKKPDPLPLLKTCEALGTAPARTLMVGDSSNDAQAAHAAGCPVVLMTYGYNHGQPIRQTPANAWLDSLADLSPMLTVPPTKQ